MKVEMCVNGSMWKLSISALQWYRREVVRIQWSVWE